MMKIRGRLVDWLVNMSPTTYKDYVVIENGQKVIYLEILRAIYGMLEATILWYVKFQKYLESVDFKFNPYDACWQIKESKAINKPFDSMWTI